MNTPQRQRSFPALTPSSTSSSERHAATRRRGRLAAAAAAASFALVAPVAEAHLSIIRQGRESAGTAETGDRFGSTVCVGDFNGDGFEDLVTAAPYEDVPTSTNNQNGALVINWGSAVGLDHAGAQYRTPFIHEDGFRFGHAMASADFNGDGRDDLAVGVPYADTGGQADSGLVIIYYGESTGLSGSPFTFTQASIGSAVEAGDRWGWALAAGDIDADGFPDLVVGSPGENGGAGSVTWMFGTASGISAVGAGGGTQNSYGGQSVANDNFGYSVAIGNFAGLNPLPPGVNPLDVAVGTPLKNVGGVTNNGMVTVFTSTNSGPQLSLAVEHTPFTMGLSDASSAHRNLGLSLAAGDFNGDGFEDLAVSRSGFLGTGEVVLLNGSTGGMSYFATRKPSDFGQPSQVGDRFGEALAAGHWESDGIADLVVGSPGQDDPITSLADSGRVYLYRGFPGGMGSWTDWNQPDLGEVTSAGDQLGYSVAFGKFDDTGRASIAAGAPFKASSTGQVHVIALWRQVMGLKCTSSVVLDCDDRIIFSQKPFDPVFLASSTKSMTILIAVERTQLPPSDPKYVSPNATYVIPDWVADEINGSQYGVEAGELVTLTTLMDMTMSVSGNDAAYAIADLLTGSNAVFVDKFNVVPAFIAEMNARAQQLGMFDTTFTNPPGFSGAVPESTAYDMALLGRAAMKNPAFEAVVNKQQWSIPRLRPDGIGGYDFDIDTFMGGFVSALQGFLPQATGLKDGGTTPAQLTGVFSAREDFYPWQTTIGSSFHTPNSNGWIVPDASELLKLGLASCFGGPLVAVPDPSAAPNVATPGLLNESLFTFYPPDPFEKKAVLDFVNLVQDGFLTEFDVEVQRQTTASIPPSSTVSYKAEDVSGHDGITIVNEGTATSSITVTTNAVGNPAYDFVLLPGATGEIPPESLPTGVTKLNMSILELGGSTSELRVFENYSESYALGDGGSAPAQVSIVFDRDASGAVLPHTIDVRLIGQDSDPGHVVGLALHEPSAQFVFDPCPAGFQQYGQGWPGENGVPYLSVDAQPELGETMNFRFGNSRLSAASGFWLIGFQKKASPTAFGGMLNVKPILIVPVNVPTTGFDFPYDVPSDPSLCGATFYHQLIVVDAAASDGLSFSRGLEVRIGN